MLNIEKYKDEILERLDSDDLGYAVSTICYIYSKKQDDLNEKNAFEWLCEEYKEPILNEEDKDILLSISNTIEIDTVYKRGNCLDLEAEDGKLLATLHLKGWFKNLEDHTRYSLEDLEL